MSQDWIIADIDDGAALELAADVGVHPITARVLIARGAAESKSARRYLEPALTDIPDPDALPGMEEAVTRLAQAVGERETIALFGDYDVDGVTGTALLALFLSAVGAQPIPFLPDRQGEGYGLAPAAVEEMRASGATLIVTIDNGTRSHEAIARAREKGIDVIVTDHHPVGQKLPPAIAIVNPKLPGTPEALAPLSGCGVAFMVVLGLRRRLREKGLLPSPEPNLRQHLDLVALGTIADAVDLVGVNRPLVRHGLAEIARSGKPGIRALMDVSGTDPARLSPGNVSYQLSPRINAAGRLLSAHKAYDLLLADDMATARPIARELDAANRERQRIEERIVGEALTMAAQATAGGPRSGLVLASKGWHVGVIGIVAAKVAERSRCPAAVVSLDMTPARGSARSVHGIDVARALAASADCLVRHGGHAMAAGFSLDADQVDSFAERFERACADLAPADRRQALSIDAIAAPLDITGRLAQEIASCQPFGNGNPEPLIALLDADVVDRRIVGIKHLKLRLRSQGIHFDAIGFGLGDALPPEVNRVALAFVPEIQTFQGVSSVQLKFRAVKPFEG